MTTQLVQRIPLYAVPVNRAGLQGLSLPPSRAGARFALGVELDGLSVIGDLTRNIPGIIQKVINDSGYVQSVRVTHLAGHFNPFVSIEGTAAYDHGSATDLQDTLLGLITTVGYRYNPASVKFTAETYTPNQGGGDEASSLAYPYQSQLSNYGGSNYSDGLLDQVANSLGVSRSEAVAIGAIGTVVLIVALKRLL